MAKPDDIPEDIYSVAYDIADDIPARVQIENRTFAARVIARAIMAERERCEAVCVARSDRHKAAVAHYPDDEKSRVVCLEGAIEALECAAAIRKEGQ